MGEYRALNRYIESLSVTGTLLVMASTWSFAFNCRFLCDLLLWAAVASITLCCQALNQKKTVPPSHIAFFF
jgi:hypothetical protein